TDSVSEISTPNAQRPTPNVQAAWGRVFPRLGRWALGVGRSALVRGSSINLGERARDRLVAQIIREGFRSEHAAAATAEIAAPVWHPVGKKIVCIDPTVSRH